MKHLKVPTKKQKVLIASKRLNEENWLVERDTPECMVLVHKYSANTRRTISKRGAY